MQSCAQKSVRSSDRFIQLYHRCYLTLFSYPWRKVKVSNVTRHKDNVRTELHRKRLLLLSRLSSCCSFSSPFLLFSCLSCSALDGSGFSNVFWNPWLILRKESERSTIIMISYSVCSVVFCNTNIGLIFMFQMSQAS